MVLGESGGLKGTDQMVQMENTQILSKFLTHKSEVKSGGPAGPWAGVVQVKGFRWSMIC